MDLESRLARLEDKVEEYMVHVEQVRWLGFIVTRRTRLRSPSPRLHQHNSKLAFLDACRD